MSHAALGNLRGRAAPSDLTLDRLQAMNPTFRLHWHPWFDGHWYWLVTNAVASEIYRATGRYRRERLDLELRAEATAAGVAPSLWQNTDRWRATVAGCELMERGEYMVRRFTEAEFGSDFMFDELVKITQAVNHLDDADRVARNRERLRLEWQMAQSERKRNAKMEEWMQASREVYPEFFADQEAMLKESWGYHMAGQRHIAQPGLTEVQHAEASY